MSTRDAPGSLKGVVQNVKNGKVNYVKLKNVARKAEIATKSSMVLELMDGTICGACLKKGAITALYKISAN